MVIAGVGGFRPSSKSPSSLPLRLGPGVLFWDTRPESFASEGSAKGKMGWMTNRFRMEPPDRGEDYGKAFNEHR